MGAQDVAFKITVQEMHVWLLELLDFAVAEQMLLCSMLCAIPFSLCNTFLEHFVSC